MVKEIIKGYVLMRNSLFLIFMFLVLCSCNSDHESKATVKESETQKSDTTQYNRLIKINSKFPFGSSDLLKYKYPKIWKGDTINYGQLAMPDGDQFSEISRYYYKLNEAKSIGSKPILKNLELLKFGSDYLFVDNYTDTIAKQTVDSIKYRLPDIGIYQCYYAFQKANGKYGHYGNILLYNSSNQTGITFNVYFKIGGDGAAQFKYFFLENNIIRLFEGACYDEGCGIEETGKIEISENGTITHTTLNE